MLNEDTSSLLSGSHASAAKEEEARIRLAYAHRQPSALYSWFNQGQLFRVQQLERAVLAALRRNHLVALRDKRILEVGCGQGYWIREFVKWGASPANLTGIDLLEDRIAVAQQLCPSGVKLHCTNATLLPLKDSHFDLICQFTVFTSVLDSDTKKRMAQEMLRVLKDTGRILWYDYHTDNPKNRDVRGIRKREIFELFPRCDIQLHRVTLAPPVSRRVAPYSWLGCMVCESLKIMNTHYLGIIRKQ